MEILTTRKFFKQVRKNPSLSTKTFEDTKEIQKESGGNLIVYRVTLQMLIVFSGKMLSILSR